MWVASVGTYNTSVCHICGVLIWRCDTTVAALSVCFIVLNLKYDFIVRDMNVIFWPGWLLLTVRGAFGQWFVQNMAEQVDEPSVLGLFNFILYFHKEPSHIKCDCVAWWGAVCNITTQ